MLLSELIQQLQDWHDECGDQELHNEHPNQAGNPVAMKLEKGDVEFGFRHYRASDRTRNVVFDKEREGVLLAFIALH